MKEFNEEIIDNNDYKSCDDRSSELLNDEIFNPYDLNIIGGHISMRDDKYSPYDLNNSRNKK
jgi:hypothetical protein